MINVGIHGSTGRVGRLLIENLMKDKEARPYVLHALEDFNFTPPKEAILTDSVSELLEKSTVVIDFTIAMGTEVLLENVLKNPTPLVIGTTGLNEHQHNLLKEAASNMPILYATNMSLGVAVLNRLVELASKSLSDFDIEIVEQHHRFKKDAPSGTALTLGEHAARGRGLHLDDVRVSGRNGLIGERSKDEIAIMALRGGDIVGRHTVGFYNDGEFIEMNHTATSRDTFAKGAIKAAKWIINQPNGLYTISDCLGL
ncbi:4-hydroxy-tetrahydrodipicolinate reductase [Sulfurospirillum barnesii]|uniref:4-hydroxy-tetrahydrodipicolinate reductase n=1 Tax=Sulfurospirillum barnesii (strain ATCC 700032 / DSM 10660 / SES-3) TaxID=760154 RepID=I3XU94_SULBS|nr:4-hydroxy-tetrahydrodipicolinate reductase [Sulfurospirillum barnesii]AFL67518.1 dihydrodipicolinate reductase [Sulfurospirillum barnesii SES-3]